jgi:hypothetical protein
MFAAREFELAAFAICGVAQKNPDPPGFFGLGCNSKRPGKLARQLKLGD